MSASLRRRIFLGTTGAMAVVVLIGALAVWFAAHALLYRALDSSLREHARGMLPHGFPRQDPPPHRPPDDEAERDAGRDPDGRGPRPPPPGRPPAERAPLERPFLERSAEPPPEFRATGGIFFAQAVSGSDGTELARSPSLAAGFSLRELAPSAFVLDQVYDARLPDHRPLHLLARAINADPGRPTIPPWMHPSRATDMGPLPRDAHPLLLVAVDASATESELRRLGWVLAALWALTTGLAAAVSGWLQRTVLKPVERISQAITGIDPANLRARIAMEEVPREMSVILDRLNSLLARLEAAFAREKGTIANIAHELRTPVAGLLVTLELAIARDPDLPQPAVMRQCLAVAESMQAMITSLLTLARLESGQAQVSPRTVDVATLAHACWDTLEARAQARQLRVSWELPNAARMQTGEEQLRMVIGNILDNAISYTPVGGDIRIAITVRGQRVLISVVNPTDGSLRDSAQVFQPFWRGESARTAGVHCGLGLALVQRLVELLGGSARAEIDGEARFHLHVDLPESPSPGAVSTLLQNARGS